MSARMFFAVVWTFGLVGLGALAVAIVGGAFSALVSLWGEDRGPGLFGRGRR